MIRKLTDIQRYLLANAIEERNWRKLCDELEWQQKENDKFKINFPEMNGKKDWFNQYDLTKCTCKKKRNGERKELCDYCVSLIDGIFNKIGWCAQDSHYVIGIKKPKWILKDLWFELKMWWKYNRLFKKKK